MVLGNRIAIVVCTWAWHHEIPALRLDEPLLDLLLVPDKLFVHSLINPPVPARVIWVQLLRLFKFQSLLLARVSRDHIGGRLQHLKLVLHLSHGRLLASLCSWVSRLARTLCLLLFLYHLHHDSLRRRGIELRVRSSLLELLSYRCVVVFRLDRCLRVALYLQLLLPLLQLNERA